MQKRIVLLFFTLVLLAGILSCDDIGTSWDEHTQYMIGRETFERVFEGGPGMDHIGRRYHGPLVEFSLYTVEYLLNPPHAFAALTLRRFLSFLLFYAGVIAFYHLVRSAFRSRWYGLLGAVMLVLSPRIFSHAFFNTRDIPALVFFTIAIVTLLRLMRVRTMQSAILHALACAAMMSTRMTGLYLPVLTLLFVGLSQWCDHRTQWKKCIGLLIVYSIAFLLLTIALWPLLWTNAVENFANAYTMMKSHRGGGFYFGNLITGNPWHWIPVWLVITTPLMYSFLFLIGCFACARVFSSTEEPRTSVRG